jgi:hypothetical protein
MTTLVLGDPLLDFQVLRTAGSAPYGGADIGECVATARRIKPGDLDSWYHEWTSTGEVSATLATRAETAGERETARLAYLRASSYYRSAGVMLLRAPLDARVRESNARQTEPFRRAGALMNRPPEILQIPCESGPQLVASLTCEHTYVRFTAAEGANDHCEAGARTLYHARSLSWLDDRLLPRVHGTGDPAHASDQDT